MMCPVCKKEFDEYTGRKPKKFCSDACKIKFWNAFKKKRKTVSSQLDPEIPKETKEKVAQVMDNLELLAKYEAEKAVLTLLPKSYLTERRKTFLSNQISKLKSKQ